MPQITKSAFKFTKCNSVPMVATSLPESTPLVFHPSYEAPSIESISDATTPSNATIKIPTPVLAPKKKKKKVLPKAVSEPVVSSNVVRKSTILSGKKIILLGKFQLPKNMMIQLIQSHCGDVPKSMHVSRKIAYLVYGPGSETTQKYRNAVSKGITVLSEIEFMLMLPEYSQ